METSLNQAQLDMLESIIDASSMADVLAGLAVICGEKSAHIRGYWQDETLARRWEIVTDRLDRLAVDGQISCIS